MDLREKRIKKGYTQAELGEKVSVSESSICLYESKKRLPSVQVAQRIAKVLGFEWTEFFE